jgi:hypothetical protein
VTRIRRESFGGHDEIGDPDAPVDSPPWCRAIFLDALGAKHDAQSRVGQFAISIRGLRDNDRWRTLAGRDGEPFRSWEDFCQFPEPFGLGLSPEQADTILDRANAERCMGELLGWGGDRRSAMAKADQADNISLKSKHGTSADYLEARLEKLAREGMPRKGIPPVAEAAELLRRVRSKEISAHAAAKAVGIVSKLDALQRLRAAWHGASAEQRRTFLAEISGHEEDTA